MPELSRSSIKDTPANEPLFRQLAGLAAGSLIAIRDLGLLDRDFLAVLPHDRDTIPAPYAPIREAIVGAMNDLPLTPVHSGGHAPARRLLQAGAGLKALLDGADLRFLVDGDGGPLDWAIAATQRNSDVDRFLRSLAIEDWDIEQFVKVLEDRMLRRPPPFSTAKKWVHGPEVTLLEWMGQKPEAWHRALYALFHRDSKTGCTVSAACESSDCRTAGTGRAGRAFSRPRKITRMTSIPALRGTPSPAGARPNRKAPGGSWKASASGRWESFSRSRPFSGNDTLNPTACRPGAPTSPTSNGSLR